MTYDLNLMETLLCALLVLAVGTLVTIRVGFLRRYNIPEAVVGGLLFSMLLSFLHVKCSVGLHFDMSLREPMMLAFFTTLGLGANYKLIRKGGVQLVLFLLVTSALLFVQNICGVLLAKAFGFDPLVGLLAGSITLSGGHGTGATWAVRMSNLDGAMEIAMACATFGLIFGGIVGGPLAQSIIAKFKLAPPEKVQSANLALKGHGYDEPETVTAKTILETMFIIAACIVGGEFVQGTLGVIGIPVPTFVCSLFLGIFLTNLFEATNIYKIQAPTLVLVSVVSLSIFLSLALMSLRLWELIHLAGPLLAMVVIQTVVMILYARFVTFPVMGKDYEAAVMAAGHVGFGLGASPTAVANMEAIVMRYGSAPQAFLVVPLVGAFFIDVINAFVIQLFFAYLGT